MSEASLLQDIVRREGRSLLQYVSEAFPWTTLQGQDTLARLQTLITEERDAVAGLSNFLLKRKITPSYLGAYPMTFTNINYVTLDYLLPRLLEFQKQATAKLEQDQRHIADPAAREQIDKMLTIKRGHVSKLQELARPVSPV